MKVRVQVVMIVVLLLSLTSNLSTTIIQYDAMNISGNQWEYTYTIANDTLSADIQEFSIVFDYGFYENIAVTGSPDGWDTIAYDPALIMDIPDNGLVNSLALVSGLANGSSLTGLTVRF